MVIINAQPVLVSPGSATNGTFVYVIRSSPFFIKRHVGTTTAPNTTLIRNINTRYRDWDSMVLDISTINSTIIITLVRRFDADSAPAIENELKKIVEQRPESVLFDFSKTEYIASAGLRVLLSTTRNLMKAGSTVALASLSPHVRQVFEIAGFTKIFTIYGSRDEALQKLQK